MDPTGFHDITTDDGEPCMVRDCIAFKKTLELCHTVPQHLDDLVVFGVVARHKKKWRDMD
jgi:hypothetical protein